MVRVWASFFFIFLGNFFFQIILKNIPNFYLYFRNGLRPPFVHQVKQNILLRPVQNNILSQIFEGWLDFLCYNKISFLCFFFLPASFRFMRRKVNSIMKIIE